RAPPNAKSRDSLLRRGRKRAAITVKHLIDLGQEIVVDHLIANINSIGKALGVDPTMAFYHDAPKAEKHPAIRLLGIELVAQRAERASSKEIAYLRKPALSDRLPQEFADLTCRPLRRLQRYVTAIAFGHDHVGHAPADAVALDKADIFELGQVHGAQH